MLITITIHCRKTCGEGSLDEGRWGWLCDAHSGIISSKDMQTEGAWNALVKDCPEQATRFLGEGNGGSAVSVPISLFWFWVGSVELRSAASSHAFPNAHICPAVSMFRRAGMRCILCSGGWGETLEFRYGSLMSRCRQGLVWSCQFDYTQRCKVSWTPVTHPHQIKTLKGAG